MLTRRHQLLNVKKENQEEVMFHVIGRDKAIVRRWIEAENKKDLAVLDELMACMHAYFTMKSYARAIALSYSLML